MHKVIRYIRQNKLQFILIILFIIFIYSFIHAADDAYSNREEKKIQNNNTENEIIEESLNLTVEKAKKTLNNFLEYSTNAEYQQAYNLLATENKEELNTLEDFKNYCENNFITGKGYNIENYKQKSKFTYKVEFNNLLSSGQKESYKEIKFFTVIMENGDEARVRIER